MPGVRRGELDRPAAAKPACGYGAERGAALKLGQLVAAVAGWLALAGSYFFVLPIFGVLSLVTWTVLWGCWLWIIGVPGAIAVGSARQRGWRPMSVFGALAVLAIAGLWTLGPPQSSPEGQFHQQRDDLARLAADYRAGQIVNSKHPDTDLPLRLRFSSIDGQAHRRCGTTDSSHQRPACALYLPAWQDWRAENGGGFAYYARPPGSGADPAIVTAAGDIGKPVRELGDGWWWVG